MSNNTPNYWSYKIYRQGFDGQPQFLPTYLSETDLNSVKTDLGSKESYLRDFLERFFRIDPQEYAKQHQLKAQALLGALISNDDCALRFGLWVPVEPPPAQAIRRPERLDSPTAAENGVRIWLLEKGVARTPIRPAGAGAI